MLSNLDESSDSLIGALTKARVPVGNHDFIQQFTAAVGIAELRAVERVDKPHVVATRRGDGPVLHIYYGYTSGFLSKDEIVSAVGSYAQCAPSSSRKNTWYVTHPITEVRARAGRSQDVRREGKFCACGMQLSLTGVCSNCD